MPGDPEIVYSLRDLFALELPSSATIYNTALVAGQWTEVVSGLTEVAAWLLYNRDRKKTEYAFVDNPSAYRTLEARAILVEDTALTQLFCRSSTGDTVELEVWEYERPSS